MKKERKPANKIHLDDVKKIQELFATGAYTLKEIAEEYNVSISYTKLIVDNKLPKRIKREIAKAELKAKELS